MEISNYKFESKNIAGNCFETIIINNSGDRFGVTYKGRAPAPNEAIFQEFQKNPKAFFIDIQAEEIKENAVINIEPEKPVISEEKILTV